METRFYNTTSFKKNDHGTYAITVEPAPPVEPMFHPCANPDCTYTLNIPLDREYCGRRCTPAGINAQKRKDSARKKKEEAEAKKKNLPNLLKAMRDLITEYEAQHGRT
tara:strand:+ start:420 stop:743 length:324 start_codon:yes stop_codon:yes gene_type:complete